jgi:hypothetical protein
MKNMNVYLNQEEFENVFKKHIKTSVYSLSIKTLFGERMTRKINYHPYYQRNYVWDNTKASFFIESILLGTDVPPLIFFNTGSCIEVIDGRQRYETIKKFRDGDLKLNYNGLSKLPQLKNHTFSKLDPEIQNLLENAKIRVFEFEVFNEPKMDSILEDKIKKEIFRRYNSGITPLNSAEIDNAAYDDDEITNKLKDIITKNSKLMEEIRDKFVNKTVKSNDSSKVLQFLRRYLVLSSFPINTYATGRNRTEIIDLLYGVISNNTEEPANLCDVLFKNLRTTINLIKNLDIQDNRLMNEPLLWAIFILVEESQNIDFLRNECDLKKINDFLNEHQDKFILEKSHHYKSIVLRHKTIAKLFQEICGFDFSLYFKNEEFKGNIKELRQSEKETKLKLDELASLRVQKPEPSVVPIEEIVTELSTNRYLLRPSYQRQEKININKASAIIESIILGINLPPIFIYKNENRVNEVIDGQQRLLSILGFLGKNYIDENSKLCFPKNLNFKIKNLQILKELNGKRFSDLDFVVQDKILEFKLSVIEIDHAINPNFEPVDLFIRLNNKPYPIKENSFEMWNSFTDKDVIESIKHTTNKNIEWFFIKQRNVGVSSDRMLNEELITFLSYICYNTKFKPDYTSIGFYFREGKVSCRITDKKDVSSLLEKITTDISLKNSFSECVTQIDKIIETLKLKLNNSDLKNSLNELLCKDSGRRYLVDFYILFQIIQRLDEKAFQVISFQELHSKIARMRGEIKDPSNLEQGSSQQVYFEQLLDDISKNQE